MEGRRVLLFLSSQSASLPEPPRVSLAQRQHCQGSPIPDRNSQSLQMGADSAN